MLGFFNISASAHSIILDDVSVPAVNRFFKKKNTHSSEIEARKLYYLRREGKKMFVYKYL